MSGWIKLSTGFYRHPKSLAAGPSGRNLYVAALAWCGEYNTDGRIPASALQTIAFDAGIPIDEAGGVTDKLVEVHFWSRTGDGWRVHDWDHWQTSAEDRQAKLAAERDRKARWRERKRDASRDADATRLSRLSETEAETETETDKELSLAPPKNTSPDTPMSRERETKKALKELAKHLAAEANRPAAYAGTIVKQELQLPDLEALYDQQPAKAADLLERYLGGQHAGTNGGTKRQCAQCGATTHTETTCPLREDNP